MSGTTRQALITPLRSTTAYSQQNVCGPTATQEPATIMMQTSARLFRQESSSSKVDRVLLKAVNKKKQQMDPKTFTLS